jgi:hypothetical protein
MAESKMMVKKEIDFFKKKGAPPAMIKHEKEETKGMKKGGFVPPFAKKGGSSHKMPNGKMMKNSDMNMKKRKFDEGGDITETPSDNSAEVREASDSADKQYKDKMTFKDAFAEARKAGDGNFEWHGKKYTTELDKPVAKSYVKPSSISGKGKQFKENMASGRVNQMGDMGMKKGGGIESRGKTKGTIIKMASGGSVGRADGIAQRGKTRGKMC